MKKQAPTNKTKSPRVANKQAMARSEILQVAERILQNGEVEDVTLAAVASELGMTKQALYHYFPSKEALMRGLVTSLLDDEIRHLVDAIEDSDSNVNTLGTLIDAFYQHYSGRMNAFRTIYCQSQLFRGGAIGLDKDTIRDEINPRTRLLFDVLEERISSSTASESERAQMRELAFAAWLSALGLMTMLSIAEATDDPLIHDNDEMLVTLSGVFNGAVKTTTSRVD
jgi:AcrR family transcriptional regulator